MRNLISLLIFFLNSHLADAAALKKATPITDSSVVILVHGWGRMPRKPYAVWETKIKPYTDLSSIKRRFESTGFRRVYAVEYDDLKSLDDMAKSVADQIYSILDSLRDPHLTLDLVGHSMGQFVAAKSILDYRYAKRRSYRLADRVRIFIGLAGIIRGQDELYPCTIFPGQCGGGGALEPYYRGNNQGSLEVARLFTENFLVLDKLKKCSVYSEADEIVKTPFDAASFRDLGFNPKNMLDVEINSRREKFHNDVKESESIFQKIVSNCYSLVR